MVGSNLPPGVTAADIDKAYGPPHDGYGHDFGDEPHELLFEDGAFIEQYECYERHCDETETRRLDARVIETEATGRTWTEVVDVRHSEAWDNALFLIDPSVAEDLELTIAESCCEEYVTVTRFDHDGVSISPAMDEYTVVVERDEEPDYRITFSR